MAKGDISGSPFCVSPDVLCMERTGDDECAYSDASSEEDDQLDVLESEDLVPASSSPVSSSPAAMTPSDTSSGELVPVIYNRHETSSQTLSSVDTGGMHDLAFESFSDDEEKVTALLEVEDHPESRTSLDTRPESQNQSAAVALADVDISTGFLRLTPLLSSPTQSSFVVRLNELLQAVQEERRQAESRRRLRLQDNGTGTPPAPDDPSIASTPASDSASDIDARVNSGPNNENATSARACSVSHSVSSSRSGESISGDPSYSHFKTSRSSSSDYWACFRSPGEILIRGASEHDGCDGTRHDIEDMCTTLPAYTHVPNSITIKEEESTPSITVILPTFKSQPRMKTMQGFVVASRPQIKHTLPTKRQSSCAPTPIAWDDTDIETAALVTRIPLLRTPTISHSCSQGRH
ncbi:hypothetical protein B0H21DRAFT_545127 [Amylocystis lapponica]|nr:hypothetical protein B0H21DRAFT_545127 [Amylocystis lapponica]